jgi:hypothetical protein
LVINSLEELTEDKIKKLLNICKLQEFS